MLNWPSAATAKPAMMESLIASRVFIGSEPFSHLHPGAEYE